MIRTILSGLAKDFPYIQKDMDKIQGCFENLIKRARESQRQEGLENALLQSAFTWAKNLYKEAQQSNPKYQEDIALYHSEAMRLKHSFYESIALNHNTELVQRLLALGVDSKEIEAMSYEERLARYKKELDLKQEEMLRGAFHKLLQEFSDKICEWIEYINTFCRNLGRFGRVSDMFDEILVLLGACMASGMSLAEAKRADLDNNGVGSDSGVLHRGGINFDTLLKILEQDSIKELCDMLGRCDELEQSFEPIISSHIISHSVKEETSGITQGRDLENLLPQEIALLDDRDFSILFDLKWSENRLLCFEKQGFVEGEIDGESDTEAKRGAMILCIDTSSSMAGRSENIAKALSLYFAKRAMEQSRPCYLISFSTDIYTLELTPPFGASKLLDFLSCSFHGGTDSIPAIKDGIKKLCSEEYKKADLLVISDFVFSHANLAELDRLKDDKEWSERQNKCHALYILPSSRGFGSRQKSAFFDTSFCYDLGSGRLSMSP